jgi:hypothetical protein
MPKEFGPFRIDATLAFILAARRGACSLLAGDVLQAHENQCKVKVRSNPNRRESQPLPRPPALPCIFRFLQRDWLRTLSPKTEFSEVIFHNEVALPMAGRSGTTFAKRQKELARKEKQREKMERRHQRKQQQQSGFTEENIPEVEPDETAPRQDDDLGAE